MWGFCRGAHTFFLKQGEVARWAGYTVNLIHYEDAASLIVAVRHFLKLCLAFCVCLITMIFPSVPVLCLSVHYAHFAVLRMLMHLYTEDLNKKIGDDRKGKSAKPVKVHMMQCFLFVQYHRSLSIELLIQH